MTRIHLEYKDGFVEVRDASQHIRGIRRNDHGGRPFNVYVDDEAHNIDPHLLKSLYCIHHPQGDVYFENDDQYKVFQVESLLGAAGEY